MAGEGITGRKKEHLDLCATAEVGFRQVTTLLECVRLVHDALPELSLAEIDLGTSLCGKTLHAPILIASMTGGTDEAAEVNRELAAVAESLGIGFGLGSQRAMVKDERARASYRVRGVAPTTLVLGNLGVVQARQMRSAEVQDLADAVGADAMCIHLNPAMELIQRDGDRDFAGAQGTIARLCSELSVPVIIKETGCGLSVSVGRRLAEVGVRHVDVSGAGGTSWVGVETLRADENSQALGRALWDWGIPTAASIALLEPMDFQIIATGGIASGLDVARALALGASACGIARPVLRAYRGGGRAAAQAFIDEILDTLRAVMLLTGSRTVMDLRRAPRVLMGELRDWLEQVG